MSHHAFDTSAGDDFQECFSYLVVLPLHKAQNRYTIDIAVVSATKAHLALERPCHVGFIPLAEDCGDLCFEFPSRGHQDFLKVTVPNEAELAARAESALDLLAGSGAHLVMFPECCVSAQVLIAIQRKLLQIAESGAGNIELVMAGSGRVHESSGRPFNECAVLSHCGEVLWRQRKLHRYTMKNERAEELGFSRPSAGNGYREDTQTGDCLVVRDVSGLGRVVVLICEDIYQEVPAVEAIKCLKPDWIFCPILSGSITNTSWIKWALDGHVINRGARGVAANSMTLSARTDGTKPCGVGMIADRRFPGENQRAEAAHGEESPTVRILAWWR